MGIYIKDYKIPSGECEHLILDFESMTAFAAFGDRKHYKLVEVTEPHKRLIDADVLARKIVESNYGVDFINKTMALIMDTPTVIEAEGE